MFSRNRLLLALSLVVFCLLLLPLKEGFTDDGFIHIQYAKNLITRGEYSFNPGEVSFGTTSPLWVIIQASLGLILGGSDVLFTTSRVLSWVSGFAAILVFYLLALSLSGSAFLSLLSSFVFACDAWLLRWTALSMETSTAVVAVLLMGLFSIGSYEKGRRALLLGFFMFVSSFLRPETYLLLPVYLLSLFLQGGKVDSRCPMRTVLVFSALLAPWLIFARLHMGSFLPNTAGAKSGGALVLNPLAFAAKMETVAKIVGSTQGLEVLFAILALLILRKKSRLLSRHFRFLLLWAVMLPLAYVFVDMQVISRYLLLITPFIIIFGFVALDELLGRAGIGGSAAKALLVSAALVIMVINVVFYFVVVLPPSKTFSHDLMHNLKEIALFIRSNSPEKAVVAAVDIGYLAFYSGRRVLDIGGLVEPEIRKLRENCNYGEIIEKGLYLGIAKYPRVDFFIDRARVARRFDGKVLQGYRFESVLVQVVANLGIRMPGPYYYTLYRLYREKDD